MGMTNENMTFQKDVIISGTTNIGGTVTGMTRAKLDTEAIQRHYLKTTDWRKKSDMAVPLPATASSPDLGVYTNPAGPGAATPPVMRTEDIKTLAAAVRNARTLVQLPYNYVSTNTVQLKVAAGMITTVADDTCTIDCEVYLVSQTDDVYTTGTDLNQVAAQSINNLVYSEKTFPIDGSVLAANDILDVLLFITSTDAASGTAVIGAILWAALEFDVKG